MSIYRSTSFDTRWMIRRDMPEVLSIEDASFQFPWNEDDFIRVLRQRNCTALVAEERQTERIVGFLIYELHRSRLHILNLAVAPEKRRQKVGSLLVGRLAQKLSTQRRTHILAEVRETNLPAQLFLRQSGYQAVSVLRDFYEDTEEDAYLFRYRMAGAVPLGSEAAYG